MSYQPEDPTSDLPAPGDPAPGDEFATSTSTMAPPPPPLPPQDPSTVPRRLVRDPYTRLGGVASGISHHYGIDVSVVRILFVLTALASGFGVLVYFLAWLVIPRAEYWPPAGRPQSMRSLSGRDLGLGLVIVGLMVTLGLGAAGAPGTVLIPLVLVGGGVWLMIQPPDRNSSAEAGSPSGQSTTTGLSDSTVGAGFGGAGGAGVPPPGSDDYVPAGPPVPPRSPRQRAGILLAVVTAVMAMVVVPILAGLAFIAALANSNLNPANFAVDTIVFTPTTIDEIPERITGDGEFEIDLRELDATDFRNLDEPIEIDADVEFGKITVIVPGDIDAEVDASVGLGKLTVFGREEAGFSSSIAERIDDADVEIDLNVDAGRIDVVRG